VSFLFLPHLRIKRYLVVSNPAEKDVAAHSTMRRGAEHRADVFEP
jgi:hypothetical protein